MGKPSGQQAISKNREKSPRVSPNMVVFDLGAKKNVEIPFVMGVMADLSGKPKDPLPEVKNRSFQDIDSSNFDARLKAARPRVAFAVPNKLQKDGEDLKFEMEFESMEDFQPDRVARKNKILAELLEHRERLKNLVSYLDGKDDAEKVLQELLEKVNAIAK